MANNKDFKGKKRDIRKRLPRVNNKIELGFYLPPEASDDLVEEVNNILASTPFSKISFPVTTYKSYVDRRVPATDNKVTVVGYIKGYNAETKMFTVIIFNANAETISKFEQPLLEVIYSEHDGKLGVITRLNIVPTESASSEDEEKEDTIVEENNADDAGISVVDVDVDTISTEEAATVEVLN